MKNKQLRTQLKPNQVVDLATNLRRKLTDLGIEFKPNTALDGVPVHLSDIYEISVAYQSFIDELVELPHTRRSQARLLIEQIDNQLYEHLPYHLKHLSKAIDDLTKGLEPGKKRQPKGAEP